MTNTIVVTSLVRTGDRSPSLWEGETNNGRCLYVRYRWGMLMIGIGESIRDAVEHSGNLLEKQLGHKYDGSLELEQLREATNGLIQWPENCEYRPTEVKEIDLSALLRGRKPYT